MTIAVGNTIAIADLEHDEQATLNSLLRQLWAKQARQKLRQDYYDAKYLLRDLGIAIPPSLTDLDMVLGWPAKAVDQLAARTVFDSFVLPNGKAEDFGLDLIWDDNDLDIEAPQVHTSTYLHACAFIAVTKGDVQSDEPEVLVSPRSGVSGTGMWDRRKRRLTSALGVTSTDENARITGMVMYLADKVVTMTKRGNAWKVERFPHSLGRPPVIPMTYQPRLDRPFGKSRLTRPVMSIADAALRTVVRSEVTAEFFSSPQRWLMGADESAFEDESGAKLSQWQSVIGRVWAVGPDEETGDLPQVGQFPQISMQPHGDHLRMYGSLFSGETGVPVSSLGISHDNPTSAEGQYAAKEDLVIEAEAAGRGFGHSWRRVIQAAYMVRENTSELPDEMRRVKARFKDPSTPSRASAADAVSKTVGAIPWLAESQVSLEQLGWDAATIQRAMADKRRAQGGAGIYERLRARADQVSSGGTE